jgi:hypothetical protein
MVRVRLRAGLLSANHDHMFIVGMEQRDRHDGKRKDKNTYMG